MPRKATFYLDTSIINALLKDPPERKKITEDFFEKILPHYEIYISELVQAEIEATPDDVLRQKLLEIIEGFSSLNVSSQAEMIAKEYLKYLRIPRRDALHIGIASVEGMDYLISWNMNHLANENTKRIVDNINFLKGIHRLYIVTPRDLI